MDDETKQQFDKLWEWCNLAQARNEALSAVVQASLPLISSSPQFAESIGAVHNARMADRLNRAVNDQFLTEYRESLKSLLPPHLRGIAET